MSDDEIDALTIGEVRAIAERAGAALEQLRAVQGLMGSPTPLAATRRVAAAEVDADPFVAVDEDPGAAHRRRQFQPVEASQPRVLRVGQTDPRAYLDPADQAAKAALIARRPPVDPDLPPEIAAMERGE